MRNQIILCFLFLLFASPVSAQVNGSGPSAGLLFDTVINVPSPLQTSISGSIGGVVDETTQLNVQNGGSVSNGFNANSGSEVNINGGVVGNNVTANAGSEINIDGGTIGDEFVANGSVVTISDGVFGELFIAESNSEVTISGGSFGDHFIAARDSVVNISDGTFGIMPNGFNLPFVAEFDSLVNISGGQFGERFLVDGGSVVNISGGTFGRFFRVDNDGSFDADGVASVTTANISGGDFGDDFTAGIGSIVNISGGTFGERFLVRAGSTGYSFEDTAGEVNLFGENFFLNGSPLTPDFGEPLLIEDRDSTLSGTLVDGSFFSFDLSEIIEPNFEFDPDFPNIRPLSARLTVTAVPGTTPISPLFPRQVSGDVSEFSIPEVPADSVIYFSHGTGQAYSGSDFCVAGNSFSSVILPDLGDGIYDLFLFNGTDYVFESRVTAGEKFNFAGDVNEFRIVGANIDTPTSVIAGIAFTNGEGGTLRAKRLPTNLDVLLGDCNQDGIVNFLDIAPFIAILLANDLLAEADVNEDGEVTFLDISPFIALLLNS